MRALFYFCPGMLQEGKPSLKIGPARSAGQHGGERVWVHSLQTDRSQGSMQEQPDILSIVDDLFQLP